MRHAFVARIEHNAKANKWMENTIVEPAGEGAIGKGKAAHDAFETAEADGAAWYRMLHEMALCAIWNEHKI